MRWAWMGSHADEETDEARQQGLWLSPNIITFITVFLFIIFIYNHSFIQKNLNNLPFDAKNFTSCQIHRKYVVLVEITHFENVSYYSTHPHHAKRKCLFGSFV